ncbi:hypothetical protein BD31_I0678 [Candidatus Nitrosopumilus salaria BD31]|uniref:Carboxypeptidase regulatory-like domain-containing protein n=1 Tax=Candidatus Nitrosopumilus salarius BD31 TaxID=859350 RepID=I3D1A7_9ARCH|nr:hypothetical protein [Candidatus Nitrosopumilus salaria]EIJ65500.1 hypothetical protein BD31_I0678 [Candidatus Nitrosopumilus salaria BD31]
MYKDRTIIIGLFTFLMLFSFVQTSEATLWDFIIDLDMQKGSIYPGESVIVTGKVVDQAYKTHRGVEVFIRIGSETTKAFTDPDGIFRGEIKDFEGVPGTYTVNVVASWYGMTGMQNAEIQVKGEPSPITALQKKLATDEAIKYLSSNESDFEKNPIGQTLFKYYHGLLNELLIEQRDAGKPSADQIFLEQQRLISENLRNQAIDEFGPGAGVFDGYKYNDYINNLNPEIKDLVQDQLNYTKNAFEEAQNIRDEIIANGGTYEEARKAYLDRISMPKELLEKFNEEQLERMKENTKNQ